MQPGQRIHESVFVKLRESSYQPKARLFDSHEWSDDKKLEEIMERDLFMNSPALMSRLKAQDEPSEEDSNALRALFTTLSK